MACVASARQIDSTEGTKKLVAVLAAVAALQPAATTALHNSGSDQTGALAGSAAGTQQRTQHPVSICGCSSISSSSHSRMVTDLPAQGATSFRCLFLPFWRKGSRAGWEAPDYEAKTYEIRSSHARRFQTCLIGTSHQLSNGHTRAIGCCRPPKLGSSEPHLTCFLLQQKRELPQQLPTALCPACTTVYGDWNGFCNCNVKDSSTADAIPPSNNLLRIPSCSSHNSSTISLKVLQLTTASGSIIPALFLHHPAAKQTLLVSHGSDKDLGCMYPLIVSLCRSLSINVLAYEYTGYGFCCCSNTKKQEQQKQQRRLCRASLAGVYNDIRAAFVWLLQHQQQTPLSIILYSEGRGLIPALWLRTELVAEGLQLGGLVFVCPAPTVATVPEEQDTEKERRKGFIRRMASSCCRKRSELHQVYMQLLELQLDELLILEGASEAVPAGKTPQLLLRQRAAAAATNFKAEASGCTCGSMPKGEQLRLLKEYVHRAGEQQQQHEFVLEQKQMFLSDLIHKDEPKVFSEQKRQQICNEPHACRVKSAPTKYRIELVSPSPTVEGTPQQELQLGQQRQSGQQ
ncbi:esterase lipase domain-containing protein [Cyclospora cayetanensis]|uniref:Esterase lipase domain-containing protein n=1 Tax=Cyclospora cayetanensis TaxID=88456 RepID=A0A1D3D8W3_9EIME|nr:esterase lipase domain-containing protein [Cyclospora cayetanensis]